jgi:hypothetical protein
MVYGPPNIFEVIKFPERYLSGVPLHTYYRGKVEDVSDPEERGRVRVRVESIWPATSVGKNDLPWADVPTVGQGERKGLLCVPEVGDAVIVAFEFGDVDYPIVIGGWFGFHADGGQKTDVPKAGVGEDDTASDKKGKDTNVTGVSGVTISEPSDPKQVSYPANKVFRTSSGHLVELDDSSGAERINVAHKSGTWAEFHPDGSLVFGVQGKRYTVVESDDAEHIKGRKDVVVDGDSTEKAVGKIVIECNDDFKAKTLANMLLEAVVKMDLIAAANVTIESTGGVVTIKSPSITLSSTGSGSPVVTTGTHPVDYVTGIPIVGVATVLAGPP